MKKLILQVFLGIVFGIVGMMSMSSASAQDYRTLDSLEDRIVQIANENPGEYGIGAIDINTDRAIGTNLDTPFPMASTMKIAVAAVYLDQVDRGYKSLDTIIAGQMAYSLMEQMIIRSNNYATDVLIADVGGPGAINAWLRQHNIHGMRVDRNIAQLLAARRNLWEHEDSSTPRAMLTFLSKLDRGELTSQTSRNIIIDMMRRCETGRNRIKGLITDGTIIEHKTGTLRNYTSDVGFMTLPDGKRIIVAFFARGGVNRPAVIATAARAIRDGYDQSPTQANQVAGWNPNYAYYERQGEATDSRSTPTGNLVAIRPRNTEAAQQEISKDGDQ